MDVQITRALRSQMESDNLDVDELLSEFANWKSGDEYGNYFFGKDSSYIRPKIHENPYALKHVHLVPLTDQSQLSKWDKAWRYLSRKTSDRHLVYVEATREKFLLIFILNEPDAHAIAQMVTQENKETMEGFLVVASEFLDTGKVIA